MNLGRLACFFTLLLGLLHSGAKLQELGTNSPTPPLGTNLSPKTLEIITLGHKRLYDDLIYLWAINHLNPLSYEKPLSLDQTRYIVNTAVHITPRVDTFYMFTAYGFFYTYRSREDAMSILEKGLEVFPQNQMLTTIHKALKKKTI